jgi:hypothetical protein
MTVRIPGACWKCVCLDRKRDKIKALLRDIKRKTSPRASRDENDGNSASEPEKQDCTPRGEHCRGEVKTDAEIIKELESF